VAATVPKEKLQVYIKTAQVKRLHRLKGETRESLSGFVEQAIEDLFDRIDGNPPRPLPEVMITSA
jgi:hypothetical protein